MATFDVIVIGSGPGACACVHVLSSQLPSLHIAVLESGTRPPLPAKENTLVAYANRSRSFKTHRHVKGAPALARTGRIIQGHATGGSTVINAGIYVGLSKEDVHACFGSRYERLHTEFQKEVEPRIARRVDPLCVQITACRALSDRIVLDDKHVKSYRDSIVQGRVCETPWRQRLTAYSALLAPILAINTNVRLYEDFAVRVILRDGSRVTGVRSEDGRELFAPIVILCAGAIGTPALLLRSELGNQHVGQHLHDHPSVVLPFAGRHRTNDDELNAHGVVTQYCTSSGTIFDFNVINPGIASLALYVSNGTLLRALFDRSVAGVRYNAISMNVGWQPQRRGRVSLDDHGEVVVEYDTLTSAEAQRVRSDVMTVLGAIDADPDSRKYLRRMFSMSKVGEIVAGAPFNTHWHLSSTCRMGGGGDGVVDETFAVHGVSGLYVGDASVAKSTCTYNTMSLAYFSGYLCGKSVAARLTPHARK